MAFTENSRVRYFKKNDRGVIEDTGWEFVHYDGSYGGWEPADTQFPRGANGTGKRFTDVKFIDEKDMAGTPLNGNVFYPRTGTAA